MSEQKGIRALLCAYACDPQARSGGEDLLGWRVVEQVARYHEVWVITSSANRGPIEKELRERPLEGIRMVYIDLPRWLRPLLRFQGTHQLYCYLWQIKAYFVVRKLHRRSHFNLFHHVTYANDWMTSFIGALLPIPYIRGPGGGAQQVPKALRGEFSAVGRLGEYFRGLGQWICRHDPFFIRGQHRAGAILACNEEVFRAVPSKWRHKVVLFPVTGISASDLDLLGCFPVCRRTSSFRVLSAGKLIRLKGFTLAIKAFKLFADKHPDAEFEILGEGPDRQNLQRLVRWLHLEGKVHLSGWKPRHELLLSMHRSDVFLFASLRDGGGIAVIEAMAAGKPVVCLDLGGPGMHVTDECGIKISPSLPRQVIRDVAQALERLYSDEKLRWKMGQAARKRAEMIYNWDRLGDRLFEIYQIALYMEQVTNRSDPIGVPLD